ncbi:hypothetical protein P7M48_24515, partial [Vibrio parahaemolyticus]|nr:hypothetical protein [Vibrio parahaemolyticus]
MINHEDLKSRIEIYSMTTFGSSFKDLDNNEKYVALSKALMETVLPIWNDSMEKSEEKKKAYYFSSEYLLGRFLDNNLINLRVKEEVDKILSDLGINYS